MNNPILVLSAAPVEPTTLKGFFETGENSVFQHLRNPPKIREMGWDLTTLDQPKILKGECWEVTNSERKRIRVYEDGTVIFRAFADSTFLGWGQDPDKFISKPRLNPIAIVELHYNFVVFVSLMAKLFSDCPNKLHFQMDLINAWFGESKLFLCPGIADKFIFDSDRHEAPEAVMLREKEISINDLRENQAGVGFQLVSLLYSWFGIPVEGIPYIARDGQGNRAIDPTQIMKKH